MQNASLPKARPLAPTVAIVAEWIQGRAGSEQVFERMAMNFPHAELFALSVEGQSELDLNGRAVSPTPLQSLGWLRRHRGLALPLMPAAWMLGPTVDADVVVTSSHAFNRFVRSRAKVHLSYVHAPMRYAWTPEIDSRGSGWYASPARAALKALDRHSTRRVDGFAANSTAVARRIRQFYQRDARVIFPPVNIERFSPPDSFEGRGDYLLGVSRWVPYKRLDLVIEVGCRLGIPVKIAGRGPERAALRSLASSATVPVEIVESPSDEQLSELYRRARLLVFPPHEDFGIVPVEAQASGTPVVAYAQGGSLDTVQEGVTGVLAPFQDAEAFAEAATRALELGDVTDAAVKQAARFAPAVFDQAFVSWLNEYASLVDG